MGFKLIERLGKTSFWCCLIGFFVAFMPLYVLGFLDMTRRQNHTDNPDWNFWLYIACGGAVIIMCGVVFPVVQLVVSFKQRNKLNNTTGDPWNGHTLKWPTASPPQFSSFAKIPTVSDIDTWTDMKEKAEAYQQFDSYEPIHMPKNTPAGVFMSLGLPPSALPRFGISGGWQWWV